MNGSLRSALQSRRFLTGAHRGASAYAPENTVAAFELAVAQGVAVLEIDVRLTRDEEVVVIHDARVDRTTEARGEVRLMTLSEIQALDAGRWFGEPWRGAHVPTLKEVLERFADRVFLDIDLKAGTQVRPVASAEAASHHAVPRAVVVEDLAVSARLARKTVEIVAQVGALDRVVLSGFCAGALGRIRKEVPMVLTQWAVVSDAIASDVSRASAEGFEVISPQDYAATEANIACAHRQGLAVFIYSPDDDKIMAQLVDLGVDAVHVDRPDCLRTLLANRQSRGM